MTNYSTAFSREPRRWLLAFTVVILPMVPGLMACKKPDPVKPCFICTTEFVGIVTTNKEVKEICGKQEAEAYA